MKRVLLFHDEMLNPQHPLIAQYPDLPRLYVFEPLQIERDQFSLQRLQFIADCLVEIPNLLVCRGGIGEVLRGLAVDAVVTQSTPQLHIGQALSEFPVEWHAEPEFVEYRGRLKRFMHYWKAVEGPLLGVAPGEEPPEVPTEVRDRDARARRREMRALARDGAAPPAPLKAAS